MELVKKSVLFATTEMDCFIKIKLKIKSEIFKKRAKIKFNKK